jgi:uncharacterized protein YcfL
MKKLALLLVLLGFIFVSCKQENNITKEEVVVDTTKTDSIKADTTKVDSTTVDSATNK